ncbi:MAG: peptidoglycan binding domain-containing protein, partial [Parcubacteria group bacterium]|nr:peptidoglycan binding domain-containing protein [Parcubacteria group bacterium]
MPKRATQSNRSQQKKPRTPAPWRVPLLVAVLASVSYLGYAETARTIRYNVFIDQVNVSGLTRKQAATKLHASYGDEDATFNLVIENKEYPIASSDIDLAYDFRSAVERAWRIGRGGTLENMQQLLALPFFRRTVPLRYTYDADKLRNAIDTIAGLINEPGKDIRLHISGSSVAILTDTKLGFVLDEAEALNAIADAINTRALRTPSLTLRVVEPTVSLPSAEQAKEQALRVMQQDMTLVYENRSFVIDGAKLGSWINTASAGETLTVEFNEQLISDYVTTLAKELNAEPRSPKVTVADGKVVDFVA